MQHPGLHNSFWCLEAKIFCLEICVNRNILPKCDKARKSQYFTKMRQKCVNYDQYATNIWPKCDKNASIMTNLALFASLEKKVPWGKKCLGIRFPGSLILCRPDPHYPRRFKYLQKNCLAKKFLNIRTIPGTFKMSIKSAWRRSVLCIRMFPGTFYIFKKSAWQKVSFTSALTQALNIFFCG